MISFLKKIESALKKWEFALLMLGGIAALVALAVTAADVLLRNFARTSVPGVTGIVSMMLLIIAVCAIPYVQGRKRHLIMEVATEKLSPFPKRIFDIFGVIVSIFVFSCITPTLYSNAHDAFTNGLVDTMSSLRLPLWPGRTIFLIAVISLLFRLVLDLLIYITTAGKLKNLPDGSKAKGA